jgi:RNA polymerase sigma-70 factor (ECF subfamily)
VTGTVIADGELVEEARNGDRAAFELVVGPLLPDAFRLALIMLRDREDAEDCVQEATFKAWRSAGRLKAGTSMRAWLLAIVANCCRDTLRRRWRSGLRLTRLARRSDIVEVESDLAGTEDVRRALRRLSPRDRAILLLRYGLDLEIEDVARAMGMGVPATKSRIHRALARLRPELEAD